MSVLNSHRSAANSLLAPDRSMSVGSITVAPWASSAFERLVVEESRVVGERVPDLIGGRGVARVDAGRCAEQYRSVGHVAGNRAGRVLVGADRNDACAAPQPERRLDS